MATRTGTDHRSRRSVRPADAESGPPLTVVSTNDRLLGESLDELMEQLASANGFLPAASIARLARLVSAVSTLRDAHGIDGDGRCHQCRGDGWYWPHSTQPCTVYRALDEFLGLEPSPLVRA